MSKTKQQIDQIKKQLLKAKRENARRTDRQMVDYVRGFLEMRISEEDYRETLQAAQNMIREHLLRTDNFMEGFEDRVTGGEEI